MTKIPLRDPHMQTRNLQGGVDDATARSIAQLHAERLATKSGLLLEQVWVALADSNPTDPARRAAAEAVQRAVQECGWNKPSHAGTLANLERWARVKTSAPEPQGAA